MMLNVKYHTMVNLPQERDELRITQKVCEPHAQSLVADRLLYIKKLNSVALVREPTIPTERPPPVGEVSANFCG